MARHQDARQWRQGISPGHNERVPLANLLNLLRENILGSEQTHHPLQVAGVGPGSTGSVLEELLGCHAVRGSRGMRGQYVRDVELHDRPKRRRRCPGDAQQHHHELSSCSSSFRSTVSSSDFRSMWSAASELKGWLQVPFTAKIAITEASGLRRMVCCSRTL
jgi:hypothetical protein